MNKEQHETLNRVNSLLEQLCSGNRQQQFYTASSYTYKRNKSDVDITSEYNDTDSVYVKPGVSGSKLFE